MTNPANKRKQRLELTWIGKYDEIKLEPRILIEDPEKSYGDPNSENILIHGDNLLALKALEQDYAGKIKCIYIDPPYNTGSAFEHYDDNLEHSIWLSLMKPRLEILRKLLSEDGSIWISLDDNEQAYLKVMMDEIFGRSNFVNNVIWEKKFSPSNDAKWLSDSHDYIMVYAKQKEKWRPNLMPRTDEMNNRYKNPDNDPRGPWTSGDCSVKTYSATSDYIITLPSGREVRPPSGYSWRFSKDKFHELVLNNEIWFGINGDGVPRYKRFLTNVKDGITSMTIWKHTEVGHNQDAKKEVKVFNSEEVFDTPKPEKLIQKILTLGSNPGDLVLDSFLGSGTTAAVAHKMGRKYIGIELGQHANTHCIPRLKAVVDGTDQGGISKAANWQGGGGFKFYNLAPSLVKKDSFGQWIIDESYNADMLAQAMCKHQGFKYSPNSEVYWKQGQSTETDFIFTTTNFVTLEMLEQLNSEMHEGESLLICAKSYAKECEDRFPNITIKKIPQSILGKCEFGKDNYDLNVVETESAYEDLDFNDDENE